MTHNTCVDELEHARAEIVDISCRPHSLFSLNVSCEACLDTCDNHDALINVYDDISSIGPIGTSYIELENKVLAFKQMHDDMSTKLVEHS